MTVRVRTVFASVLAISVLAVAAVVILELRGSPVRSIRIAGEFRHVTQDRLRAAIAPHLVHNLLEVDVDAVRAAASELPWIKDVSVRRVWPDSLHVAIVERSAVARWGDGDLIEADGALYRPESLGEASSLVRLSGPDGSHEAVLEGWRRAGRALAPLERPMRSLELTPRGGWRIELEGGPTLVLGVERGVDRLDEYARALPAVLRGRLEEVERVDLRYVNGFAVRYRAPEARERAGAPPESKSEG